MNTSTTNEKIAMHKKVVQAFRDAKRRKREWQERMDLLLSEREERVRQGRNNLLSLIPD